MELTGNPFVDSGMAVMAHLAGRETVSEMGRADVRALVGDGTDLARTNSQLKLFTMVFGTNGPLTQPAYKKAKKNESIYCAIVARLLQVAAEEGAIGEPCELTGIRSTLNFHQVCAAALAQAGQNVPEQKWIGRDWVPLAGSLGNDARALPSASRPLHVSATALIALQYLPMGLFLFQGRLACFQSTYEPLMQLLTTDIVVENKLRSSAGEMEILGKGSGAVVLVDLLLKRFERLQKLVREFSLPENTSLLMWLFSNSGTGADCRVIDIPDRILRFLHRACMEGFAGEIRRLVASESKDTRQQFFTAIREGRDYPNLYPFKKWEGTSQEFYEFYQTRICGWTPLALGIARRLAKGIVTTTDAKRLKEIRKSAAFRDRAVRNAIRGIIEDTLNIAEYDALFPSTLHPVRVEFRGWDLIRYYLSQIEIIDTDLKGDAPVRTTHPKIGLIAEQYFKTSTPKRVKDLLDRMRRGKAGLPWLRDVFCNMAEEHKEFELGDWGEFLYDEEGRSVPSEILFQIRLDLANRYRLSQAQLKENVG